MLPVTTTTSGAVNLLSCAPSTLLSSARPSKSSVLSLSTLATSPRSSGSDITGNVAAEVSIDRHVSLLRCCPADHAISLPATPFRAIKVFICTSGLDMQREQTSLVSQVYCQLREYCRHNYGLDFHAIDLQWSPVSRQLVSDHNTLAQISVATIGECHAESAGPSFVALIGQRYGEFQGPPKFIRVVDFDLIRDAVSRHKARDVRTLAPTLCNVYERDLNSVDPQLYRLKDNVEYSTGPTASNLKRLVMAAIQVCLEEGLMTAEDSSFYTQSVFELLLRHGIETSTNPSCQCFVVHRTILDLKNYADLPLVKQCFAEVCQCDGDPGRFHLDSQAQRRLAAVVSELVGGSVPPDNVISRTVLWRHDDGISDTLHRDYLDDVCRTFCSKMTSLIDQMVPAQGYLVPLEADSDESKLELEVLQHWNCAVQAVENFQGREDLVELIQSYIMSTELKPLVLFGEVGAGKTAVVAKAAIEASNWIDNGTLVSVVRFANATCASRDVRHIVSSICAQLYIVLVQCDRKPTVTATISQSDDMSADCFYSLEYEELVQNFHCLLAGFPEGLNLAVFIDGIDLLYNGDDGSVGTRLDWIPGCLQEHVKLVLSVRRGDVMLPLKRDLIPDANNYVEVTALSPLECQSLLASELLLRYNRQLSEKLLRDVIRKCCGENGAQPMLIKLVASIVNRWSSSGVTESELEQRVGLLPLTLDDAADAAFECVEERFGRSLVGRVLGLLTASESGLSDIEMEDILSLDDVTFDALPDRGSSLKIKRMPSIVWFGIKHQLVSCGFLTSRDCQHVRVNLWKHEMLASRAAQRYLSDQDTCRQFHSLIADYFLGKWAAVARSSAPPPSNAASRGDCNSKGNRLLPTQPIIFDCQTPTGRPRYNLRKLNRLPVHLQRAGRRKELDEDVLFNYEWMYHKSMAVSYDSVIDDYRLSSDSDACLVYVALCQCKRYRGPRGENIAAELTGRLLPYISVHPNIQRLIADCDRYGPALSPIVPNFPYQLTPGVPLKHTIQFGSKAAGSGDCVTSSRPTEFFIVGGQSYGLEQLILAKDPKRPEVHVIDPCTGSIKTDLMTSIGSLHVSPSGRVAIVADYDRDKSIKVHRLNGFGGEDSSTNFEGKSVSGHKFEGRNGFVKPINSRPQSASYESISVKTSSRRASAAQDKSRTEKGQFVGHLVPSRLIEMSTRDKHRLTQICVADTRLGLAVESTVDTRSWLMIADLVGCSIIHVDQYRGHVTGCRFLRPHDSRVMYVGVGNRMYTYHLEPTVCRASETVLDDAVRLMAFSKSGRHGYVAGDRIDCVIALTLDVDPDEAIPHGSRSLTEGSVKSTTELELGSNLAPKFTEIPAPRVDEKHQIIDLEVSSNEDLLLIRGRHVLIVVHVGWNRILKVIERPADVPFEFRLPQNNGTFTTLQFTQAHFTEDSAFVVASIFRDIYIWPIDSDMSARLMTSDTPGSPAPLATLRASIGLISDLFVTSSNTSVHWPHPLVSVDKNSMRLDVWDARVAMATATPTASLDRMTSSIRDVVLTDDDSLAFVSANGSDAVAVFDMRSGQMADLMTHEDVVTSFSMTSDGRFMLVSLLSARPGQFNKIWDTQRRCISLEFGDVGVYSCPLSSNDGFFVLCQTVQSVCEPYHVMQYRIVENKVTISQLDFDVPFVLDRPFLTSTDRYLIVFHAADYDQYNAHYIDPTICAVALRAKSASSSSGRRSSTPAGTSLQRTSYGARELKGHVPAIKRILAVRPYPTNSYNVVVLYTNESDRAGSCRSRSGLGTGLRTVQSSSSIGLEREGTDVSDATVVKETLLPGGYEHNFGFLIYDVCSAVVCQVIEDCFPPYTDFSRLISTYNHRFYVDQDSNLYDMATGYCVRTKLFGDAQEGIQYQAFSHDDRLLIGTSKDGYLHVVRIEDGQTIASLCVHGKVTALTVCHDTRTILVGCEDGTLLSYVIIDATTDADCHQSILQSLGTRHPTTTSSGRRSSAISASGSSRAWDKVDRVTGSAPPYSRPPSAVLPSGPSDKLALGLARSSSATTADATAGTAQQQQQQLQLGARRASSSQLYRLNSCRSQACAVM